MQKLINLIALLSGLVSLSVVGGGAYLYLNKDTLVEDARAKVTKAVTEAVTEALPGMIDGAMPKMPEVTGPALPSTPSTTGPALPF
jgi:phage tail protein X